MVTQNDGCYCGEIFRKTLFLAEKYIVAGCTACGQIRVVTPRGIKRKQFYQADDLSVYIEKEKMFSELFRRIINFIKQYKQSGTLVDIGAGVGLLVREAKREGFRAYGFEPSKSSVKVAKKYFGINLFPSEFKKETIKKIDVIILNHVLEHLHKPTKIVDEIYQNLNHDGLLVIGVPNFSSFISTLKRGRWQSLIPDQHRWQFTPKTLDNLVLSFGFKKMGVIMENHDRSMHPFWKRPIYWILDNLALLTGHGEAMLVIYKKL